MAKSARDRSGDAGRADARAAQEAHGRRPPVSSRRRSGPFFFGAATWAVIAIALWLCALAGRISLPTRFDACRLASARNAVRLRGRCGRRLSADGYPELDWPAADRRQAVAVAVRLVGGGADRRALLLARSGLWPAAILDVGLFVSLARLAAREVIASKNRNVPIVGLVFLFGLADAADYAGAAGLIPADVGWRGAIALVIVMISTDRRANHPVVHPQLDGEAQGHRAACPRSRRASICW